MLSFPNAKINLGLNITRKREDGYHDLETIFYPINIKDVLEVIPSADFSFTSSGLAIGGNVENNLCLQAYNLLKKDFPGLPSVKIHLHKGIPTGAGLGGGSSDGAFMLQMLNDTFQLNIPREKLMEYALQLGSDCPFFIINKPCFATGRGEQLEEVLVDLTSYHFVVVNPQIHVSTKEAFAQLTPNTPSKSVKDIVQHPIASWKDDLKNHFEEAIFNIYPAIADIKEDPIQLRCYLCIDEWKWQQCIWNI